MALMNMIKIPTSTTVPQVLQNITKITTISMVIIKDNKVVIRRVVAVELLIITKEIVTVVKNLKIIRQVANPAHIG